jgi:hypothetical protein
VQFGERMLAETKGDRFQEGMMLAVSAYYLSGLSKQAMHKSFLSARESFRRSRLIGWMHWSNFCKLQALDVWALKTHPSPELLFADFLVFLDESKVSPHQRGDCPPAVQALFNLIRRDVKLTQHGLVQTIRSVTFSGTKSRPRYTSIWKLPIILDYIRSVKDFASLSWFLQRGIAVIIFMIYLPCRPIALINMDPSREVPRRMGKEFLFRLGTRQIQARR